jgi:HTH-type transcriptional regulator, transcriptional repressor of NAD biosynthesis genes
VLEQAGGSTPAEQRAAWLREIHPGVDVRILHDAPAFDRRTSQSIAESAMNLGRALKRALGDEHVDLLYTSEAYGEVLASAVGARHHSVDRDRTLVPCTGTLVRRSPAHALHWLEPVVRAHYVPRVCIAGAESTGKTTLCEQLAQRFNTLVVEEYGREYTMDKAHRSGLGAWEPDEFFHIAFEQQRREDEGARRADPVMFCDTDAFTTRIWYEFYLGGEPKYWPLPPSRIALYLLPFPDVPFVADEIREGEHRRFWMHGRFVSELSAAGVPFVVLEGSYDDRLAQAIAAVTALIERA